MVLIVTLLIMVAMLLVSTALLRSTNTSVQVVGNLSFRQAAESTANIAVERAVEAVTGTATACPTTAAANDGLYTFKQAGESPEGIPAALLGGAQPNGVCSITVGNMTVTFIVEPMCDADGNCLSSNDGGGGDKHIDGESAIGGGVVAASDAVHRVSIRVDGAKNTTVFAQAFID
jgi:Tfp pilus assembly protein PilX